jgi:parallel beta-helix repeat protein
MTMTLRPATLLVAAVACWYSIPVVAQTQTFTVDCERGQTISKALEQGDLRKPLVLTVRGTCTENVIIKRDDVTLQGQPQTGATVAAANAGANTITVSGARTVMSGLTVTGGAQGIFVLATSNFTITDSVVKGAAYNGISVVDTHVKILRSTIELNGAHGIALSNGGGRVESNMIRSNVLAGIHIERNAAMTATNNTITANGSNGVELLTNSQATFLGNTVSANGTNPGASLRNGIDVRQSRANILDGNSMTNNVGVGVQVVSAFAEITNSTITGNGLWGVGGDFASTIDVVGTTISGNGGGGMTLRLNTTARITGATIQNNVGYGLRIRLATKMMLSPPATDATGNTGWGLECQDAESSVNDTTLLIGSITGCTGY